MRSSAIQAEWYDIGRALHALDAFRALHAFRAFHALELSLP